jgi:hypothetical protein
MSAFHKKQAERIEARARVAAESGESLEPKRAPLIQDFAKQFLEWLDKTTPEQKTKNDYKNGRSLILQSALCGMRMDQITSDDVETTKFHESPHSRNCAIRTLRRMLGKVRDWKLIREVPRIINKSLKVFPRDRMVTLDDERQLLASCPRPLKDVLIIAGLGLETGKSSECAWSTLTGRARFISTPRPRHAKLAGLCR